MFRRILTIATLIIVVFVLWNARSDIAQVVGYLANTNLFFIFLLIPEQVLLYYCSGQIFFSYLSAKKRAPSVTSQPLLKKFSAWLFARFSLELNFVNQAIPSGGFAGLSYVNWRLRPYGLPAGQISFVYLLRYIITISTTQLQTLLALLAFVILGGVSSGAWWVVGLTSLTCVGIILAMVVVVVIASSRRRISWFAKMVTKIVNGFVRGVTFGHKRQVIQYSVIEQQLDDIYKDLMTARENKRILLRPALWGIIYSFLEVVTYWLVSISMGYPTLLPQIMIAAAVASLVSVIMVTPGGIGGYEGAMIFIMSALGAEPGLATAIVLTTRIIIMVGTLVAGYTFYQNAMSKVAKRERKEIIQEVK